MKHEISHDIGVDLAKKTAEKALQSYRDKYPQATIDVKWKTDTSADVRIGVKGVDLKGTLAISASSIVFDMSVPLMLRPFQGKAMSVLDREVNHWIGQAKSGALA